jgi:hypothetical protein
MTDSIAASPGLAETPIEKPRRRRRTYGLAKPEVRLAHKERIESRYSSLTAKNANVVEVLFIEAKSAYASSRDRLTALDGKAATLIGIVTTGFGAIALLGDPSKMPSRGVWTVAALAALAAAFGLALASLAPRPAAYPALSNYNVLELVINPSNEARVKFDLTEAWLRDAQQNAAAGRKKSLLLKLSIAALVAALLALATNYILSGEKPTPSVRVIFDSPAPQLRH